MNNIARGLAALVLLCVPTSVSANSLAHCLQQGLLDAGHDPKGVDGQPGSGTFKAADAYLAANADADLPQLNRSNRRDLDVLAAWCAHFDPPVVLYGNGFQTIKNQSTGVTNFGYHGVLVMRYFEYAKHISTSGVARGGVVYHTHLPLRSVTRRERAFIDKLANPEDVNFLGGAEQFEADFFGKLTDSGNTKTVLAGADGRRDDVVHVGKDGVWRGMQSYDGELGNWFYRVAPLTVWDTLPNGDRAINWEDLTLLGIERP